MQPWDCGVIKHRSPLHENVAGAGDAVNKTVLATMAIAAPRRRAIGRFMISSLIRPLGLPLDVEREPRDGLGHPGQPQTLGAGSLWLATVAGGHPAKD